MTRLFISLFILLYSSAYSQSVNPSVKKVIKILKSNIDQSSKNSISVGSGEWLICNDDSAFFKKDTLKLYNNINFFYQQSKCCDFIGWTFYKTSAFVQSNLQICKEPSSRSTRTDYYKAKMFYKKGSTYLLISKLNDLTKSFKIININTIHLAQGNQATVVTLRRLTAAISSP
ncbi:hypothetical protein CKK33_07405 [Mucilaginibacter sp. MD40]|uniref:hypothetical protein n=1 Tax=Mucilaginibacter sp. MD40 TaxID=2029590 RepID=UPI000BAC91ED|nr:hypothetical protein [Mucilaginibacter sp. MD40]PAW93333.1 hypothetical protein CKK33_07405 [Mucilaginibacter sp. MD40]